jgi:tetratricopeptide (TPR) repeat protein
MDDARKLWLWTPKMEFWEYLAYVLRAYGWRNRLAEAEKLASQYVDDPSTPSDGAAILGNSYAAILMYCGRVQQALAIFQQIIQESPRNSYAGYAYYWFALRAIQAGDFKKAGEFSANIRECLDDRSQLSWMRDLIIKSRIITEMALGTPPDRIASKLAANYPEKDLKRLLAAIQTDRKKVL